MNIKKILLITLSFAIILNCSFPQSKKGQDIVLDYSIALKYKQEVINNLDYYEESNDGCIFTASASDKNEINLSNKTNVKRMRGTESKSTEASPIEIKTDVTLKYNSTNDSMFANVKQTTLETGTIGKIDTNKETILVDKTAKLTPKLVHHENDDEVYVEYDGQEFNLRDYVEKAQDGPNVKRAIVIDDLAFAALVVIAAALYSICINIATVGVTTEHRQVTSSSDSTQWYEVVATILLFPFSILTSDSARSSTTYEDVQTFDPSQTSFEINILDKSFILRGYSTMSAARVAVESTQEGSFYPCLFFPVQGWFFMSPIPLSNPKSEATAILLTNTRVSFEQMHINKNDYTKNVLLELSEALDSEGSVLSVYTFLQSDALEEIKYVNGWFGKDYELTYENHAREGKAGIQFNHYHPGNHEISDSHMCFGLPIVK